VALHIDEMGDSVFINHLLFYQIRVLHPSTLLNQWIPALLCHHLACFAIVASVFHWKKAHLLTWPFWSPLGHAQVEGVREVAERFRCASLQACISKTKNRHQLIEAVWKYQPTTWYITVFLNLFIYVAHIPFGKNCMSHYLVKIGFAFIRIKNHTLF